MADQKHSLDLIVHIGAGRGKDLKEHLAEGARRIVLIDADPRAIPHLERLAASVAREECEINVIDAAVSGEEKQGRLHIYNLERLSGLCAPVAAGAVYPGLKLSRTEDVTTRAANDAIAGQGVDPDKENLLVIEAPGEELAILQNLSKAKELAAFSRIKVNASREALGEGAATASEIASFLEDACYIVQSDDHGDWAGLSALIWRSRRHKLEMDRISKELARVEEARAAHEKKVIELSRQNANMAAEIEKQKGEIAALDRIDRKSLFDAELSRCESQLDHLKGLFANGED